MLDSQKRIAVAFVLGAVLIAGSFYISRQNTLAQESEEGTITVSDRNYIAVDDSNENGLPDWQDALQDRELVITEEHASSTYQQPETVTGKFALSFFEDVIRSKNYGAFGETPEELITRASEELASTAYDELLSAKDITSIIAETDTQGLRTYGNQIALILTSQDTGADNEAIILQDSLRYDDVERIKDLDPIIAAYTVMAKQLLEVPVPKEYLPLHLNLLNAVNAVREDIKGMRKLYDDPLYTFLRVKRYQDDVLGMFNATTDIYNTLYTQDKVRWGSDEPATRLMKFSE